VGGLINPFHDERELASRVERTQEIIRVTRLDRPGEQEGGKWSGRRQGSGRGEISQRGEVSQKGEHSYHEHRHRQDEGQERRVEEWRHAAHQHRSDQHQDSRTHADLGTHHHHHHHGEQLKDVGVNSRTERAVEDRRVIHTSSASAHHHHSHHHHHEERPQQHAAEERQRETPLVKLAHRAAVTDKSRHQVQGERTDQSQVQRQQSKQQTGGSSKSSIRSFVDRRYEQILRSDRHQQHRDGHRSLHRDGSSAWSEVSQEPPVREVYADLEGELCRSGQRGGVFDTQAEFEESG